MLDPSFCADALLCDPAFIGWIVFGIIGTICCEYALRPKKGDAND